MKALFGNREQALTFGFWLLAILPALSELQWMYGLLLLPPLLLHRLIRRNSWVRWITICTVLTVAIGWVELSGQPWLSAPTIIGILTVVLLLKWSEAHSTREFRLLTLATLILATLSSLFLTGLPALAFLLCCGVFAMVCLLAVSDHEHVLNVAQLCRTTFGISLLALPIAIVLFVTVPRLQGPLWDIGLAIGLPIELAIDQDAKDIGLKGSLKAGQISRIKRSDAPVLVAEFEGPVPYKSRLYWRGPVFSDYDGEGWNLPENWNNRNRLLKGALRGQTAVERMVTQRADRVHYAARVSPHGGRWLYALDLPSGQTPEAFISGEYQLLGIRKISREFKYDVDAWLEYRGGRPLTTEERIRYLSYPAESNPQLRAYGRELDANYADSESILHQLRTRLVTGGYQLSPTTDIKSSRHNLDQFFFDRKEGTIEHLASSAALLLRAAGIPTRLVTGYRGGSLIALTNFIVVKQEHAHVWVEAWVDKTGWQRIEAKDFVAPPAPEQTRLAAKTAKVKPKESETRQSAAQSTSVTKQKAGSAEKKAPTDSNNGWLNSLSSGIETWILNYNPDRQIELMKKSGLRVVDWKNLVALTVLALVVLCVIYSLILQFSRPRKDPVVRSFTQLNHKMQKLKLGCAEQECPSVWIQRVAVEAPALYPALRQVVQHYLHIRYGVCPDNAAIKLFQRDVKRLIAML